MKHYKIGSVYKGSLGEYNVIFNKEGRHNAYFAGPPPRISRLVSIPRFFDFTIDSLKYTEGLIHNGKRKI